MSDTNDSCSFISTAPTADENADAIVESSRLSHAIFATFNILHGRSMHGSVDLAAYRASIRALRADVIGLQEVDVHSLRSERADLAKIAGTEAGLDRAFGRARWLPDLGQYGNALLAKSMSDVNVISLPKRQAFTERRVGIIADVEVRGMSWSVGVTHMSLDRDESKEQLLLLLERLSQRAMPRVLMGDFNRRPDEVFDLLHSADWSVLDTGPTFPSRNPEIQIDYIAVQGAEPVSVRVESLPTSDHCAVIAELRPFL